MIPLHNKLNDEDKQNTTHENGMYGVVALFLIMINAFGLYGLLKSIGQDSNRIDKLLEPSEETLFFAVPAFVLVSLIVIWGISPGDTQMNKIFKIATIIGFILFVIYSIIINYLLAFGSARP